MKLYRSISGNKELIGEAATPEELEKLGEIIFKDARGLFITLNGSIELKFEPGIVYAERRPGGLKYTLED
jgi:hypothetical protein